MVIQYDSRHNENKIIPSLWFEAGADEAMRFYASVFPDSEVIQETPVVVTAKLGGVKFIAINGGPADFKPNPSISFMVYYPRKGCERKG